MAMALSILGNVNLVVPGVLHKVDGLSAGVVGTAVVVPLLLLAGWYVHIDRRADDTNGDRLDDHRLRVDQYRRRNVANLEMPVEAGFSHGDRYTDIVCQRCSRRRKEYCKDRDVDDSHASTPLRC